MHKVAVYGTLKQGHGNHRLIEQDPIAYGVVKGHRLFQSGIPFLIDDKTSDYDVHVEVYEVDDQKLERLDSLEGHPTAYRRVVLDVHTEEGEVIPAWTYEYPTPVGVENTSGVF